MNVQEIQKKYLVDAKGDGHSYFNKMLNKAYYFEKHPEKAKEAVNKRAFREQRNEEQNRNKEKISKIREVGHVETGNIIKALNRIVDVGKLLGREQNNALLKKVSAVSRASGDLSNFLTNVSVVKLTSMS